MMPNRFIRATASVLLFTFSVWVAEPSIAAINMTREKEAWLEANRGAPLQMRSDLNDLTRELAPEAVDLRPTIANAAMTRALTTGANLALRAQRVLAAGQQLLHESSFAEQEFAETARAFEQGKLPGELRPRYGEALTAFEQRRDQFRGLMGELSAPQASGNDAQMQSALNAVAQWVKGQSSTKVARTKGPRQLTTRKPEGKPRDPADNDADLQKVLPAPPANKAGVAGVKGYTVPPTPSALGTSEEVVITPAIQQLAQSLNNNPVKIYNWVRNNIKYVPTYGSIQGAPTTLTSKQGNAFDTSSLLIALLRAANIPAHYVYGTIDVPAAQAQNWIDGVENAGLAQD